MSGAAWYLYIAMAAGPTSGWAVVAGPEILGPMTAEQCRRVEGVLRDHLPISVQCREGIALIDRTLGTSCHVFEIEPEQLRRGRP